MATNGVRGEHQRYITLQQLVSDLTPVAYLWNIIGTYLNIQSGVLHNIKTIDGEANDCLLSTIEEWLNKGRATKAKLVEAVKSPSIRKQRLSDKIAGSKLPDKLKIEHLPDVVKAVADLAALWHPLGVQLEVSRAKLRAFENQPRNVHRGLDKMLEEWMEGEPRKEDLFDALKSGGVNHRALAETLEEKYRDCILVTELPEEEEEVENHKPETPQCETLSKQLEENEIN